MEKVYGHFLSSLPVSEIKKDFHLNNGLMAFIFKKYIGIFGYPDIGGAMRFPKVLSRLSPKSGEKILDIGCGRGFYSHYIAKSGAEVTGIDDGPFVEIARSMGRALNSAAQIQRANITKTQEFFKEVGGLFDKIIAIEVLEHLIEDKQAFADWCFLLKSGGRLVFSVPFATEEEIAKFKPDLIGDPYGHKRAGYTLEQIKQLCSDNGLKIIEQEIYCQDEAYNIGIKNANLYNSNKFMAILLHFPIWKWKCLRDKPATADTAGYHAIILTLEKA
jgi:SAM-dependent methyltransferase